MNLILMEWPANSPDLNPIENIWSILKYRIGLHFPTTRAEVEAAIQTEWNKLSHSDTLSVCQNLRERGEAVIKAKGGHTKY